MTRLLVTGGAGFIGANFVHYWCERHSADRIVVLDALTYAGNLSSLDSLAGNASFRFVHGDIRDQPLVESLLRDEAIDTIVHFAAESHVDRSIACPDPFLATNVLGTHSLLKAARNIWLEERGCSDHRFHHVSTDEVYGSLASTDPAFTEASPYAPSSLYAASKAASDHIVRAYWRTYGLRVTVSNGSNSYGPYHFPEKLIPLAIVRILAGETIPIYGDGRNVRDWLHVSDHCRGIELILERGEPGESYNIGGHAECENLTLIERVCSIIDERLASERGLRERFPDSPAARGEASSQLIGFVADRAGHDRRYAVDTRKIREALGFSPRLSLTEGLALTVAWYLDNEAWWRPLVARGEQQRPASD